MIVDREPSPDEVLAYIRTSMREIDKLPRAWAKLIHAYGYDAEELYNDRIPATTMDRAITPEIAARALAHEAGIDLLAEQFFTRKPRRRERRHPRWLYL